MIYIAISPFALSQKQVQTESEPEKGSFESTYYKTLTS